MTVDAQRESVETDTLLEYRGKDGDRDIHNTSQAKLFVDRENNRLGIRDPNGDGLTYVPLSDVLELLKRTAL